MDLVDDLVCSLSHLVPRKISDQTEIKRSSVRRMVKTRHLQLFKGLKTPQMREGNRRESRASSLQERFKSNARMIEKTVWQDEKDFTLEVPVNLKKTIVYNMVR